MHKLSVITGDCLFTRCGFQEKTTNNEKFEFTHPSWAVLHNCRVHYLSYTGGPKCARSLILPDSRSSSTTSTRTAATFDVSQLLSSTETTENWPNLVYAFTKYGRFLHIHVSYRLTFRSYCLRSDNLTNGLYAKLPNLSLILTAGLRPLGFLTRCLDKPCQEASNVSEANDSSGRWLKDTSFLCSVLILSTDVFKG